MLKKLSLIIFIISAIGTINNNIFSMQSGINSLLENLGNKDIERLDEKRIGYPLNGDHKFDILVNILRQILGFWGHVPNSSEINKNFKPLALKYHPDRNRQDPLAEIKFKILNAAYNKLKEVNNAPHKISSKLFGLTSEFVEMLNKYKNNILSSSEIKILKDCGVWNKLVAVQSKILLGQAEKELIEELASAYFKNKYANITPPPEYESNPKAEKKTMMLGIVNVVALWDIINSINDVNKINVLGTHSPKKILDAAALENVRNVLSTPVMTYYKAIIITILALKDSKKYDLIKKLRFLHLLPDAANIKFIINNAETIRNADKIALYNKESKRNLSKAKQNQYIWLTVNKLAPYAGFALARKINENSSIFDIFTNYEKLKSKSFKTFEILKIISNISEIFRKNQLYKTEMGNYKNHKPNSSAQINT